MLREKSRSYGLGWQRFCILLSSSLPAIAFAMALCLPARAADQSAKAAALTSDDVSALEKAAGEAYALYPALERIVQEKGLDALVRALLRHDRAPLRTLGLRLTAFHRLGPLVEDDVLALLKKSKENKDVYECAIQALPSTGIRLTRVIEKMAHAETQVDVVTTFGHEISAQFLPADVNDWGCMHMRELVWQEGLPIETRRAAWLGLAQAELRAGRGQTLSDEEYWPWAEALQIPDDMYVRALLARKPADLQQRLKKYLGSSNKAARVHAAGTLARAFNESEAVPVLIDCFPCFGDPMVIWFNVGFGAYQMILRIDDGVLLDLALSNLEGEEAKSLSVLLGGYSSPREARDKLDAFLAPRTKHSAEEQSKAAAILARWLKPRMKDFYWYVSSPGLRLIRDTEPRVQPPGPVGQDP